MSESMQHFMMLTLVCSTDSQGTSESPERGLACKFLDPTLTGFFFMRARVELRNFDKLLHKQSPAV